MNKYEWPYIVRDKKLYREESIVRAYRIETEEELEEELSELNRQIAFLEEHRDLVRGK